jgi:hypothetical protein
MRVKPKLAAIAVLVVLGAGPGAAQMMPPAPGSGTISPLGIIDPTAPVGGSGIPLGVTELFTGGLAPVPVGPLDGASTCPDTAMTAGGAAASSANPPTSSGCAATGTGFPAAAGLSSVPGAAATTSSIMTSLGGPNIPLGATDLGSAGLSGPIGVPAPSPALSAVPSSCPGPGGIAGITPGLGPGSPMPGGAASPGVSFPLGC